MVLQMTCERSSHLMLLDITKLLSSLSNNEQISQRLFVHLNSPFGCIKLLVSVITLASGNKRVRSLVVFELKSCSYF